MISALWHRVVGLWAKLRDGLADPHVGPVILGVIAIVTLLASVYYFRKTLRQPERQRRRQAVHTRRALGRIYLQAARKTARREAPRLSEAFPQRLPWRAYRSAVGVWPTSWRAALRLRVIIDDPVFLELRQRVDFQKLELDRFLEGLGASAPGLANDTARTIRDQFYDEVLDGCEAEGIDALRRRGDQLRTLKGSGWSAPRSLLANYRHATAARIRQEMAEVYTPALCQLRGGGTAPLITPQADSAIALVRRAFLVDAPGAPRLRWIVTGDPGAGKTTELRHVVIALCEEPTPVITPVFISLAEYATDHSLATRPLLESVAARLPWSDSDRAVLQRELAELTGLGRVLVVLDGLDEVEGTSRQTMVNWILALPSNLPSLSLLVSVRRLVMDRLTGFSELEVLPFESEQRRKLVSDLLDALELAASATEIVEELNTSAIRHLAGNPYYVSQFTRVVAAQRDGAAARIRDPLDLHLRFIDLLLHQQHRGRGGRPPVDASLARLTLNLVALQMVKEGRIATSRSQIEKWIEADRGLCDRIRLQAGIGRVDVLLDAIADGTNVLGPFDRQSGSWAFWHRIMRDALAADAVLDECRDAGEEMWSDIAERAEGLNADEDHWAEVYSLLVSRSPAPGAMIQAIAQHNRALAFRAAATASGLVVDDIVDLLQLSDDEMTRRKEWEQFRGALKTACANLDPERALDLLGRLSSGMRDGNNLYHIGRAAEEVSRRRPALLPTVLVVRAQRFRHMPRPDGLLRAGPDAMSFVNVPGSQPQLPDERSAFAGDPGCAGFRLSATHVTIDQFRVFDPVRGALGRRPVTNVTWYEAVTFCEWLAQLPEYAGARLPTFAEWAYAYRLGVARQGEQDFEGRGRTLLEASRDSVRQVTELGTDGIGLCDMLGNVHEWCMDKAEAGETSTVNFEDGPRLFAGASYRTPAVEWSLKLPRQAFPSLASPIIGFRVLVPEVSPAAEEPAMTRKAHVLHA